MRTQEERTSRAAGLEKVQNQNSWTRSGQNKHLDVQTVGFLWVAGGGDMKTNSRTEKNEEVLLHDTIRAAKWSRTPAFPGRYPLPDVMEVEDKQNETQKELKNCDFMSEGEENHGAEGSFHVFLSVEK
ncbi:hypothetical protein OJAV_G00237130 [Oryzias javanicus]|uniref:Uncharacterized protein n=1 Tax=Oryzias javanicus TaxID=123683 RepID=A0A3S2LJP7_ORYJA|nr:hypothetical protein OJAV_G00237130 [Oryzias javanicus]